MNTPVTFAVTKANEFLRIAAEDHLVKQGAKAITKAVSNTVLTVLAAVETIALAILTAVTFPLKFAERTQGTHEAFAKRLEIASSTVKNAASNIVGNMKQIEEIVKNPSLTRREQLEVAIKTAITKVSDNPGKTAATLVAGLAVVFAANYASQYFAAPEAVASTIASKSPHVYALVQGVGSNACPTLNSLSFDKSPVPALFV